MGITHQRQFRTKTSCDLPGLASVHAPAAELAGVLGEAAGYFPSVGSEPHTGRCRGTSALKSPKLFQ